MYFFIDTEFTDFRDCDLISLGLVSEDGNHEFYVEITDYKKEFESDFVKKNIVPLLDNAKYGMTFNEAANALKNWIEKLPTDKIDVVFDYGGDWYLFVNLVTQNRPQKEIQGFEFKQAFLHMLHQRGIHAPNFIQDGFKELNKAIDAYFVDIDNRQHHSLVDAKSNRHGWIAGYKAASK